MPAFIRIERRNPDKAVNSRLRRKQTIRILADGIEGDRLDASFFPVLIINHSCFETILLGPSKIHAHEHLGPILSLSSSGAGMNVHDRIEPVIFIRQQHLRLDTINEFFKLFQMRNKVIGDGLTFAGKFHQCLHVTN